MMKRTLCLVLPMVLALLLCSIPVAAQPPMPPAVHIFWGTVTIDGSPAPDGTTVSVHIGDLFWSTTTKDGKYGYEPPKGEGFLSISADDPATAEKDGGEDGDEITFRVNSVIAATYAFEAYAVTELNLSINTTEVTFYTLTVNVSPSGSGTVALSPGVPGNQYASGSTVTLTANPASGYAFDYWSGDLTGSTNPTTITMNADKSVTANFEEIPIVHYDLTISSTEGGAVTEPGEGTFTYEADEVVSLEATSDDGYQFDEWTGDVDTVADVNDSTTTLTIDGDKSISAVFSVVTPGVSPATFSASNLSISPQEVQPDQQVEVSINITNDGGTTGSRTVLLYINGNLEDSYTVRIAPGSTENVVFTVSRSAPGTYVVLLEDLQGQFTVVDSSDGLSTAWIIAIVAIIAVGIVVAFVARARRRQS
jgi:hypothetical protein